MDFADEYRLSFYKDMTPLDKKNKVMLVRHADSGELFVKKKLPAFCENVYSQLKSANIAGVPQVIECIKDDENIIVIEEYIHGRTLMQLFEENGVFCDENVKSIALNLCNILTNLHDINPPIIHRDIKPSNLILSNDGFIKLVDFDAAKNASDEKNKDTHLLGTENFAAPEQYGFGSSDQKTDIYGAGATLNYLLTGKYPNEEITDGPFRAVIEKCLALNSNDRFQNATLLYETIDAINLDDKARNHKQTKDIMLLDNYILGDIEKSTIGGRIYLPVGFRTLSVPRMIISICIHTFLFYILYDEYDTILNNILFYITPLFIIAWFGNYLGIRNFIKNISNNEIVQWLLIFVLGFILSSIVFLLF